MPSDWLAAMTSMTTVITNTVATSAQMTSDQRPHSQPSFTTSAGPHPPFGGVGDSAAATAQMLQHLEQGIQVRIKTYIFGRFCHYYSKTCTKQITFHIIVIASSRYVVWCEINYAQT